MEIKIKYLRDIEHIEKIEKGDMIDLRAGEDVVMKKGEFKLIPLGIAMELPEGYEAHIYPRSSTYKNYHIIVTNSVGIVDNSYNGDDDEWLLCAYAMEDTTIAKNSRICQFRVFKRQEEIDFVTVDHLGNSNRGGIGSTGDK